MFDALLIITLLTGGALAVAILYGMCTALIPTTDEPLTEEQQLVLHNLQVRHARNEYTRSNQ